MSKQEGPEAIVREIRRKPRKQYSAEEKIRSVIEGLRGEQSIAECCRSGGIAPELYKSRGRAFWEGYKQGQAGNTQRRAAIWK